MAQDAREKLLAAAYELFGAKGYAGVGTRAIAEAAGVNEVTLFRIFGTKHSLWQEIFDRYVVRPTDEVLGEGTNGDWDHDVRQVARNITQTITANINLLKMNLLEDRRDTETKEELASQPQRMNVALVRALEKGPMAHDRAVVVARTIVDSIFGVAIHFEGMGRVTSDATLDRWLEDFLDLVMAGLRA